MATVGDEPRLGVSVYLIKPTQTATARAALDRIGGEMHLLNDEIPGGLFVSLPAQAQPPGWLPFVSRLLPDGAEVDLTTQAPGGLLWIPRGLKIFVLTFGFGHTRLKDEWVEPEFGKVVALSLIPQGQVVEVRAEQVFAKNHISSERAPRASAVREFGFEPDRDLVAAVEGKPATAYTELLGLKIRGGTSLRLGVLFSKIFETLDRLAERFDSMDHARMWPEANNLVRVRDATKISDLDVALEVLLVGPSPERLVSLAAPAERNGDTVYSQNFVIGRMGRNVATAPYLTFSSWTSYLRGATKADRCNVSTRDRSAPLG